MRLVYDSKHVAEKKYKLRMSKICEVVKHQW